MNSVNFSQDLRAEYPDVNSYKDTKVLKNYRGKWHMTPTYYRIKKFYDCSMMLFKSSFALVLYVFNTM